MQEYGGLEVLAHFVSVKESTDWLVRNSVDLLFLDVQLPDGTGFDILEALNGRPKSFKVVFTTAYEKYAVDAIKASAFDYLLKPVKKDELSQSLERLKLSQQPDNTEERIRQLLFRLQSKPKIRINTRTGFLMIAIDDIIYCEADGNYTVVHYKNWKKEISTMHLGLIEMQIRHPDFLRVSRSLLINTNYLFRVDRKEGICQLEAAGQTVSLKLSEKSLRVIGGMLG